MHTFMTFKLFLSRFIILLTNLNIYAQQIVDLLVMSMKNYFIYIFCFSLILNSIHIKKITYPVIHRRVNRTGTIIKYPGRFAINFPNL